jgi:hypothetical protein
METSLSSFAEAGEPKSRKQALRQPLGDVGNVANRRQKNNEEAPADKQYRQLSSSITEDIQNDAEMFHEACAFLRILKNAPFARVLPPTTDPFSWPTSRFTRSSEEDDLFTPPESPLKPECMLIWSEDHIPLP